MKNKARVLEALETIAKNQAEDANRFDGQLFTGKTVAEYLANQGASIAVLADIVKSIVEELKP